MIVLDASVLIAHLNPDDAHHPSATAILLSGSPGEMHIHMVTLAEVLVGGVSIGRGREMRQDVTDLGIVVATTGDSEALRLAELRVVTGLKLSDCCVLDLADRHRAVLATFDIGLATAARRRGLTVRN